MLLAVALDRLPAPALNSHANSKQIAFESWLTSQVPGPIVNSESLQNFAGPIDESRNKRFVVHLIFSKRLNKSNLERLTILNSLQASN